MSRCTGLNALALSLALVAASGCTSRPDEEPTTRPDAGVRRPDAGPTCDTPCGSDCCASDQVCDPYTLTCCRPSCSGLVCGDDGCGGSCGACGSNQRCSFGQCVACQRRCDGKACGDDGCGGSCGTCSLGYACSAQNTCVRVSVPDAGVRPDAGAQPSDAGTDTPDAGGPVAPVDSTVQVINDTSAPGHPAAGTRVHFRAVVTSPRFRVTKNTNGTDPASWSCLWAVFVADPRASSAEYNGLMLTGEGSVDPLSKSCRDDSPVHPQPGESEITIGEELDITGYYREYCGYTNDLGVTCLDLDQTGREIRFPQVATRRTTDVVRLGLVPGLPSSLPLRVNVVDVYSKPNGANHQLGDRWWKLRGVLVTVENVIVSDANPDAPNDYCEFRVAPVAIGTPTVRVDDALMFGGTDCPHRPVMSTTYTRLTGVAYWGFSAAKLLPRSTNDSSPPLPSGIY